MKSPNKEYELRRLEGEAERILQRGTDLSNLGKSMTETAIRLNELADSSTYKSKATDKLVKTADEVEGDLRAAAVRYSLTGTAVTKYGTALATAQEWIHPRIDDIEAAENAYQAALKSQESAESERDRTRWPWEDEPTASETQAANDAVSSAAGAVADTKSTRDTLWNAFEDQFDAWETAYGEAVRDIENAMETAGNNDGFWEALDLALEIIGYVIIALTIIALVIGAPLTGALALVILALSVVVLAGKLLQYATGRATLADVAFAALGLLPFGIGKILSKGAPALGPLVSGSRGVVTAAIRDGLPARGAYQSVTGLISAGRNVVTAFKNLSLPFRSAFAPVKAWSKLPHPGVLLRVNPITSMRLGPEGVQVQRFVQTMRQSSYSSQLAGLAADATRALPSVRVQRANVGLWFGSMGLSVATDVFKFNKLFGLENVTVDNGPVR